MMGLGIGTTEMPNEAEVRLRTGWVKSFKLVLSSAGGMAAVLGLFALLQKQPEGFKLLGVWGPWPIVVMVALAIFGRLLSRLSDSLQTTFSAVVSSSQQNAEAQMKTADALTRLADQGGKQAQEITRLAIYAAQEFPSVYERLDKQDQVLEGHGKTLSEIADVVKSLARGKDHGE